MPDEVREIKSRLDIVDVIGDYVALRRQGNALWGLCPFHREKTPSFSVSPERSSFHCFGCNKGGDIFTFVMEMEGMTFTEALEALAARAGVTLTKRRGDQGNAGAKKSADRRAILEEANAFFRKSLVGAGGAPARAYLERRAVEQTLAARFELGWSPQAWTALVDHLASLGRSADDAVNAGLAGQGVRGLYDRFRGRLIFPVRDEMGRLAGFGGRLIDGEGAKYVNSPEGDLFNKRRLLYFLHQAKKSVREKRRVILMEGYMDVIRAHEKGFTEAVASLGTALTEEQTVLIKRFADLCYISYDADAAGQEAALRGMYLLQERGVEVRVISLPEGQDPDDVLRAEGGETLFGELIERANPLPLYHAKIRKKELRRPETYRRAREDLLNGLASLPFLDVAPYLAAVSEVFGILPHELQREIETVRNEKKRQSRERYVKNVEGNRADDGVYILREDESEDGEPDNPPDLECMFCSLLWRDSDLRARFSSREMTPLFADEASANVVGALLAGESPEELERRWRTMGEDKCLRRVARGDAILAREGFTDNKRTNEHIEKLSKELREKALRRRYEELRGRRLRGETTGDEEIEYADLLKKLKCRG